VHAVRLAGDRPGGADGPGHRGARTEARRETGKTPVLDGTEWRKLIDSIPTETVGDLHDRVLIATLTYSFARVIAALRSVRRQSIRPPY
jgi:hypothetical protein